MMTEDIYCHCFDIQIGCVLWTNSPNFNQVLVSWSCAKMNSFGMSDNHGTTTWVSTNEITGLMWYNKIIWKNQTRVSLSKTNLEKHSLKNVFTNLSWPEFYSILTFVYHGITISNFRYIVSQAERRTIAEYLCKYLESNYYFYLFPSGHNSVKLWNNNQYHISFMKWSKSSCRDLSLFPTCEWNLWYLH